MIARRSRDQIQNGACVAYIIALVAEAAPDADIAAVEAWGGRGLSNLRHRARQVHDAFRRREGGIAKPITEMKSLL